MSISGKGSVVVFLPSYSGINCEFARDTFHSITTVEYVRFVGCNWSFYPGGLPHTFSQIRQFICPRKFRVLLIVPRLGAGEL
jgi:hypothetical protein